MSEIGHNKPPSEFDEVKQEIEDLYNEAKNWADGEPIATQEVADNVAELIKMIKNANKKAEMLRKKEVAPLDNQKRAIQDKYAPLTANTKTCVGKGVLALKACQDALLPFNQEQQRIKDEEARKAREEAERKEREAQEALQAASLEDREEAQELMAEAQKAKKQARKAAKDNVKGMRTAWKVRMNHPKEAAAYFWKNDRDELLAFFQTLAERKVREGMREIPGFKIEQEKVMK